MLIFGLIGGARAPLGRLIGSGGFCPPARTAGRFGHLEPGPRASLERTVLGIQMPYSINYTVLHYLVQYYIMLSYIL